MIRDRNIVLQPGATTETASFAATSSKRVQSTSSWRPSLAASATRSTSVTGS